MATEFKICPWYVCARYKFGICSFIEMYILCKVTNFQLFPCAGSSPSESVGLLSVFHLTERPRKMADLFQFYPLTLCDLAL